MAPPKKTSPVDDGAAACEVLEDLPPLEPLPWKNRSQYQALKKALFAQLAPTTLLQRATVQRIFEIHWEQYRSKVLRRDLNVAGYRKGVVHFLTHDFMLAIPKEDASALADNLTGGDRELQAQALAYLSNRGVSQEDIRAWAYLQHMQATEALERRSDRQDARRRALMQEYEEMKKLDQLSRIPDADADFTHDHGD